MKCNIEESETTAYRRERKSKLLKDIQSLEWKLKKGDISLETYQAMKRAMSDEIKELILEQAFENQEREKRRRA